MKKQIKIDFVSDVSCPWCAIGLQSLQTALKELDGELDGPPQSSCHGARSSCRDPGRHHHVSTILSSWLAVSTWGVGLDPYILEVRDIGVALGPVEPPLSRHMWTYQVHETSVIVPEHDTRPLHRHSARGVLTVSLNPSP